MILFMQQLQNGYIVTNSTESMSSDLRMMFAYRHDKIIPNTF